MELEEVAERAAYDPREGPKIALDKVPSEHQPHKEVRGCTRASSSTTLRKLTLWWD